MLIPVADLETLESVKQLILIKKKPNRKPFPKEQAMYSKCGMRCDLCVYYLNAINDEEKKIELQQRLARAYGEDDYTWTCPGCFNKDTSDCKKLDCAREKGLEHCLDCADYPCGNCGLVTCGIDTNSTLADDITWAVLPYVPGQYGN